MVTRLDAHHNCLISSCDESNKKAGQRWPKFHIYDSEIEPASVVLRKHSKTDDLDSDKLHKKAMHNIVYFIFLSTLIAISHKIIRQTVGFKFIRI